MRDTETAQDSAASARDIHMLKFKHNASTRHSLIRYQRCIYSIPANDQNNSAQFPPKMPIQISPLTPTDIPSAVHCIQAAFAEDPYNHWIFHRENFSLARNTHSLSIRCKWGIQHALFHVAKDTSDSEGKVLGVACWLPPLNAKEPQTWKSWFGDWWLWWEQVKVMLHDS